MMIVQRKINTREGNGQHFGEEANILQCVTLVSYNKCEV